MFSRAREDLRAANLRINQMLADYGDVVPRREFEMIETSYRVSNAITHNFSLTHTHTHHTQTHTHHDTNTMATPTFYSGYLTVA